MISLQSLPFSTLFFQLLLKNKNKCWDCFIRHNFSLFAIKNWYPAHHIVKKKKTTVNTITICLGWLTNISILHMHNFVGWHEKETSQSLKFSMCVVVNMKLNADFSPQIVNNSCGASLTTNTKPGHIFFCSRGGLGNFSSWKLLVGTCFNLVQRLWRTISC